MVRVDIAFEAVYKAPTLPIAADLPATNGNTVVLRTEIKRACFGSAASTCSLRDKLGARRAAGFPSNVAAYVTAGPTESGDRGSRPRLDWHVGGGSALRNETKRCQKQTCNPNTHVLFPLVCGTEQLITEENYRSDSKAPMQRCPPSQAICSFQRRITSDCG